MSGPKYSRVTFPASTAASSDVDFGRQVIPDSTNYALEQTILGNDTTLALVHLVVITRGACVSAVGGTIQVVAPAGAQMAYFTAAGIPDPSLTSIQDVTPSRPAAVLYNVPVGATFDVRATHPTCKQLAFPLLETGKTLTGQVPTAATAPAGDSAAIVIILE